MWRADVVCHVTVVYNAKFCGVSYVHRALFLGTAFRQHAYGVRMGRVRGSVQKHMKFSGTLSNRGNSGISLGSEGFGPCDIKNL